MNKRIVICADGTWNRPEKNSGEDFPAADLYSSMNRLHFAGIRIQTTGLKIWWSIMGEKEKIVLGFGLARCFVKIIMIKNT